MGEIQKLLQLIPKAIPKIIPKDILNKALPFLNSKETTAVGLDWNGSEVRVVEVRPTSARPEIVRCYAGSFDDSPELAIQKALALANVSASSVRVAVSGEGVIVRYLKLPMMKKEEIPTALSFELEKYLPYKESEVVLDYQVAGETKDKKMRLLIVAARRNLIEALIQSFKQAKLELSLIDVAGFSVCNALMFNQIHPDPADAIGVVHVTKELTTVNVLKENSGYFSRDISMGQTQVSSDQALLVDLANEVRYSLDYYESQWNDSVKKIYLSGQLDRELFPVFEKEIGLEAAEWDPTAGFQIAPSVSQEDLAKAKRQLHLALGLTVHKQ